MISNDVIQAISDWTAWASKDVVGRYDIALLKIWIQFERFLGATFIAYSTGQQSEKGYCPNLKIRFLDEEQFNIFMRDGNKTYIEYIEKIEKLSKHVFVNNPFDVIFLDSNNKPAFEQMKALRNYIAHESGEARRKVIDKCFSGDERKFVEPNDFLKSTEPSTKTTYYTYYIGLIQNMVNYIIDSPS